MVLPRIILKRGREISVLRRHPWLFSGAIAKREGDPGPGKTVAVISADGRVLGRGGYSPCSQIAVRLWTFEPDTDISEAFIASRLEEAIRARCGLPGVGDTTALRLVNAESDYLPGLVADRYGRFVVCQFTSAGAERWKAAVATYFAGLPDCDGVYERSDGAVRHKEGLQPAVGVLAGEHPPERIEVREGGCRYGVDVCKGHKTGFYLDQRDNRALAGAYARGRDVLNCYAYTGGFAVAAMLGGARCVTNIDTSAPALALGRRNLSLNGIDASRVEDVEDNVSRMLRTYRDSGRDFDMIVLDPPKFVESRSRLDRGLRGYKDINLLAVKLLRPGGVLFTFSCSGLVDPLTFRDVVAGAARDAGRDVHVLRRLSQGPDHPVALSFPEGHYLKGLVCRVS